MELGGTLTFDRALQLVLVASVLFLIFRQSKTDSTVRETRQAVQETQAEVQETRQAVQTTQAEVQETRQAVQTTQAEVQETRQAVQTTQVQLQEFKEEVPHSESAGPRSPSPSHPWALPLTNTPVLPENFCSAFPSLFCYAGVSKEVLTKVRSATFAILDSEDHPVCCGFFVTACGVALTAAHEAEKWLLEDEEEGDEKNKNKNNKSKSKKKSFARAATYDKKELKLEVVERNIGGLDIAVLRVPTPATAPWPCLPVPETTIAEDELSGAAVNLIHGSIAWFSGTSTSKCAQRAGSIVHTTDTTIHYDVGTYKGDSGAALLLSGTRVIGLHSSGFNDLAQEHSESSPSTAADAVRLDHPKVRAAVLKCIKKSV
jgi:Sec-independent protein translocase protein TatA